MKLTTKQLTLCAVLTALALALSYLEGMFPISLAIPLPGVKLGLANIVTMYALCVLGAPQAFLILLARCALGAVFAGNASALLYSLLGGVAALAMEAMALRFCKRLSVFGVSMAGAAAHNCGQVGAAMVALGSITPLAYLPILLMVSLLTGTLTGFVVTLLIRSLPSRAGPKS